MGIASLPFPICLITVERRIHFVAVFKPSFADVVRELLFNQPEGEGLSSGQLKWLKARASEHIARRWDLMQAT